MTATKSSDTNTHGPVVSLGIVAVALAAVLVWSFGPIYSIDLYVLKDHGQIVTTHHGFRISQVVCTPTHVCTDQRGRITARPDANRVAVEQHYLFANLLGHWHQLRHW